MRTGEADALGIGFPRVCGPETEPCAPAPAGEAPGAGEAQDPAATDSSTHAAASRAPVPLSGPIGDHPPGFGLTAVSRSLGEAEDGEWPVHGPAGPSGGFGDVGASGQAQGADGQV